MDPSPSKPPVRQWLRLSVAAAWKGMSTALMLSEAERAGVRVARLGDRGLIHLAADDLHLVDSRLEHQ